MIILFENATYNASFIKELNMPAGCYSTPTDNQVRINCVGYFFSTSKSDAVFILPKVFLKASKSGLSAFGTYNIDDFTNYPFPKNVNENSVLTDNVFNISFWIYLAIKRFQREHPDSGIILDCRQTLNITSRKGTSTCTLIDVILSLIDFHKKHQTLLTYYSLISHSGKDRIHWTKTINHSQPYIVGNQPFYLDPLRHDKQIDYNEQLISLFYSVLNYLNNSFKIDATPTLSYRIIPPKKIRSMIASGKGTRLLKSIRKRYFKDEFVLLWNLLYTFFAHCQNVKSKSSSEEALIAKDFNIVFEAMTDSLVSDPESSLPRGIREQRDGKIIDHIYLDKAPFGNGKIYYIGDSKYYLDSNSITGESIYKQYTYARNVIQECINLYYREPEEYTRHGLAYRDPITEGYCPTPNFFIRGKYFAENDNPFSTTELHINRLDFNKKRDMQFQFPGRLFDRDTLILMTFEVNFMYILHAFATGNDVSNARAALRSHFRKGFMETLESLYEIKPLENVTAEFVVQNFHEFNGKVFYDNANKRFLSASPRLPISSGRGHGDFCN